MAKTDAKSKNITLYLTEEQRAVWNDVKLLTSNKAGKIATQLLERWVENVDPDGAKRSMLRMATVTHIDDTNVANVSAS